MPPPAGTIVNVSTESQLQAAVAAVRSNTTIMLAPGTYTLTSTLWINVNFTTVGIRGATHNRDEMVLVGRGMTNANYGNVPYGIWSGGAVQGITIANLTIRDVYYHPVILNTGTEAPLIYNVRLLDAGWVPESHRVSLSRLHRNCRLQQPSQRKRSGERRGRWLRDLELHVGHIRDVRGSGKRRSSF